MEETYTPLFSEILDMVHKAKTKTQKVELLRNHGLVRNKKFHWKYDIKEIGYNYRISDINCALGLSQIKRLNQFIKKRKKIFDYYNQNLRNIIKLSKYNSFNKPSFHLYLISIDFRKLKTSKDNFIKFMKKNNIMTQYHYIPIYKFSIYKENRIKFNNSEYYYENTVSLPIYYDLDLKDAYTIVKKIKLFLRKYTKSVTS